MVHLVIGKTWQILGIRVYNIYEKWPSGWKENLLCMSSKTNTNKIIEKKIQCFRDVDFLKNQFLTISKLNACIKLEEQPKLANRYQALPGFSGNTIPAYD